MFFVYFVVGAALISSSLGNPAYRKEFDKILDSNSCLKSCMANLTTFGEEISLIKNPNLQRYFGKIDGICELISGIRECIDDCQNVESNPFALESVNAVCQPEIRAKISALDKCLSSKTDFYQECAGSCGDYNAINFEVHQLTQDIKDSELKENGKVDPIMAKTNEACGSFKCMSKCNVEVVKHECDENAAALLQEILQHTFDAHFADLKKLNIVETMSKTIPPQCNYMWNPRAIFGNGNAEASNIHEYLAKVQLQLLEKQLKLADKQDDLITRENQKLDLEMDLLSQKLERKQQQSKTENFEESRLIFS